MVLLFVIMPVFNAVINSFKDAGSGTFSIANYTYFFTDPLQLGNLKFTLYICVITVILAIVSGYLLALYIRFSSSKVAKYMATLNLIPRFIPGLVAVYAMIIIIRDAGVINRLSILLGMNVKPGLMYNAKGIILMNLWFNIPFATLIIGSKLATISNSLIESSRDIGASKLQIFRKILWPLSYREALIAATFIFMSNVGSFTTPFLLGGNYPQMLGVALYAQFNSYMAYNRAAALSVIMFLICLLPAVVYVMTNMKEVKV